MAFSSVMGRYSPRPILKIYEQPARSRVTQYYEPIAINKNITQGTPPENSTFIHGRDHIFCGADPHAGLKERFAIKLAGPKEGRKYRKVI